MFFSIFLGVIKIGSRQLRIVFSSEQHFCSLYLFNSVICVMGARIFYARHMNKGSRTWAKPRRKQDKSIR